MKPIVELYLKSIVDVAVLHTEYLSDIQNWLMARDEARSDSLTGFKVTLMS